MRHSRMTLPLAAALLPALAAPSLAAETAAERAWDPSAACLTAVQGGLEGGSRCLGDQVGRVLLDEAARFATRQGRTAFGDGFRLVHRMSWSPLGKGLAGDLDAVIPLASRGSARTGADPEQLGGSAFFLQQGVTRWTDKHGFRRNDVRLGTAFRFASPGFAGADVWGASALVQQNVERGHQRLVVGADFAGRWGEASLQHFVPTTDWRPGRAGYEERALGGTEASLRFDLTSTVTLDTAVGRWERDEAGRSSIDGRLGLGWRPHSYLRLDAGTGVGPDADPGSFLVSLDVPFGGASRTPKWEGLGTLAAADAPRDIWRPVENVGRIRTAERVAPQDGQVEGVSARFLQSSVSPGDTVEVEVSLSEPAPADMRLSVRLAPGGGNNPAVAGVDYTDEPAMVTIRRGATTGRVTFHLPENPALDTDRTLSVTVARAA